MQIMTLKQWHSNDRKSKINTRTYNNNNNNNNDRLTAFDPGQPG